MVYFKREKRVRRKGADIIEGYISLLEEIEKEIGNFSADLKGTDWHIIHQKGIQNFFLEGSSYSFKGLTIEEAKKEMERYVKRKFKSGDSISIRATKECIQLELTENFRKLRVFESERKAYRGIYKIPAEFIDFLLPETDTPFNFPDMKGDKNVRSILNYAEHFGLKDILICVIDYLTKKCNIGVRYCSYEIGFLHT